MKIYPMSRQLIFRKCAGFCIRGAGEDIEQLIQAIYLLYNDLRTKYPEIDFTDDEWQYLKLMDTLTKRIKAYSIGIDTKKIDPMDSSLPKFIEYREALCKIPLIQEKILGIFYRLLSKTNLKYMSIPSDYFVDERKEQKEFKPEQRPESMQEMMNDEMPQP